MSISAKVKLDRVYYITLTDACFTTIHTQLTPFTMVQQARYHISVPDSYIIELKSKLRASKLPDELHDVGWAYGVPLSEVRRLVQYWQDGYDWRAKERMINDSLPQYTADIDVEGFGVLNIHYVYQRSPVDGAIPLLFIHGCTLR